MIINVNNYLNSQIFLLRFNSNIKKLINSNMKEIQIQILTTTYISSYNI